MKITKNSNTMKGLTAVWWNSRSKLPSLSWTHVVDCASTHLNTSVVERERLKRIKPAAIVKYSVLQRSCDVPEGWRCSSCGCCGFHRSSRYGSQGDESGVPSPRWQSGAPVASAWVSLQHSPAGWQTTHIHKLIIRGFSLHLQCLCAASIWMYMKQVTGLQW